VLLAIAVAVRGAQFIAEPTLVHAVRKSYECINNEPHVFSYDVMVRGLFPSARSPWRLVAVL